MRSALTRIAGVATMVVCGWLVAGCTPDACEEASDKLAECLMATGGRAEPGTEKASCEGPAKCSASCINAASCEAIKDAFSGMPTEKSKAFIDCSTKCVSAER